MFNHHDNDYGAEGGEESGYSEALDAGYSLRGSLKGALAAGMVMAFGALGCGDNNPQIESMTYEETREHLEDVVGMVPSEDDGGATFAGHHKDEELDFYYLDEEDIETDTRGGQVIYQGEDGWKQVDGVQDFWIIDLYDEKGENYLLAVINEDKALQIESAHLNSDIDPEDKYYIGSWVDPDKYEEEDIWDHPNIDDGLREDGGE